VHDRSDLTGRDACLGECLGDALQHALLRRGGCRQHFARPTPRATLEHDVGERSADIRGEPGNVCSNCQHVVRTISLAGHLQTA
jgi:hypothetical protein